MLRRSLRRLRFALFAVATTAIIAFAVLIGLAQLAMPWLVRNPRRIEAWLSERLHQPVSIGAVSGAWVSGGPLLTLDHVRIGSAGGAEPPLEIPQAELALSLYAPFEQGRAWSEFRIVGLDVQLVRDADAWHLRGFDVGSAGSPGPSAPRQELSMGALGVLVLKDFKLAVDDPHDDLHLALAASELRVVNLGATTHVAGKVRNVAADSAPLDLIADIDVARRSGIFYAGGHEVDLGRFAEQNSLGGIQLLGGKGDAQFWVTLAAGRINDARVRMDMRDATLSAAEPIALEPAVEVVPRTHFDRIAFVARWVRKDAGWTADIADLAMTHGDTPQRGARVTIEHHGGESADYRAAATDIDLEPLGSFAMLSTRAPAALREWLYLAHPQGLLSRADVRWTSAEDFQANATLSAAGFASAELVPGIERFNAEVHGDAEAVMLELAGQPLRIEYPRVFRKPFVFAQFGGDIVAFRTDDAWRIDTDRIAFEGDGESFGGELRGGAEIQDDGTRPLLDLYAIVTHADVTASKLFWPTDVMPPQAVEFLDRALVDGRLDGGRVLVRGDLDSWPFHDSTGRFEARGHIVETVFDYNPEWPRAEHLTATANFINDSMQVEVESAEVKGNHVTGATASIANFGEPVLELAAKGNGSGANLLDFLRASPVGKRYEDTLKDLTIGGKGDFALTLNLPMKEPAKVALDGAVDLADANLDDAAFNLHFVDAAGSVRFNQGGFAAGPLSVGFRQQPARLTLAVGGFVSDPAHAVEASLVGRFPMTTVFADVPDILPALARFPGESVWTAALSIDASADPAGGRKRLTLTSDLRGTAIDLPAPLAKTADIAQSLELALDLPFIGQVFSAKLGDLAAARGRLPAPDKPFAALVAFGAQPTEDLPARGAMIAGHVSTFDAGGWLDLTEQKPQRGGGAGSLIAGIDVRADDFTIAGRSFGATRLIVADKAGATELKLDGAAVAGVLTIPGQDIVRQGVTARLERFHWPDAPPDAPEGKALDEAAPGSLPPLHIAVEDFMLGKANFGAAAFESYPIASGMHIDKLESRSPNVSMTASGDWTGVQEDNRSHLKITLTAQSLGRMMDALGFPGLIDGGQTKADIDAIWPGPPSAFGLAKLETGAITLNVAEGRILDVNPGAGRIFGLLSLSEIPRRLSLDFSDFFRSGLSFNSITGTFGIDAGNAYTSDLLIKSPAADIAITGRTGLRARDYDQQMVVSPHTGATLPIVGAIAAGPVGAAAGLVLQGVLGKPIGKAMGSRYRVSGSWEKPEITLIAKEKAHAPSNDSKAPETELH